MKIKNLYKFGSLLIVLLLAGCLSPGETIFMPLNANVVMNQHVNSNIGRGKVVTIATHDERPNDALGIYLQSFHTPGLLKTKTNLKQFINRKVAYMLTTYGFKPNDTGDIDNIPQINIRILGLHGGKNGGVDQTFAALWEASAFIEVTATNHGKRYKKSYYGLFSHRSPLFPNSKKSVQYINLALSRALTEMANDQQLFRFLSK